MLTLYHQVKNRFEYENNLDIVPFDLRYFYQDLECHRIHSEFKHDVMEMIGYHVNERICVYCDLYDIDDELHAYFIKMSMFKSFK